MRSKPLPISEIKGRVHAAIVTIRQDEYNAMESHLQDPRPVEGGNNNYEVSTLPTDRDETLTVSLTRCISQGNLSAQAVANNIIQDLDPAWLILVGIAGGVPDSDFSLGDVIIASALQDFSFGAATQGGGRTYQVRGGAMHPEVEKFLQTKIVGRNLDRLIELAGFRTENKFLNHPPLSLLQNTSFAFYGKAKFKEKTSQVITQRFPGGKRIDGVRIWSGPCANGDLLLKDTDLLTNWRETARQIVEVETELAGVYESARTAGRQNYPLLAIRGLSDIVGLSREPNWTQYACDTAAALTYAILRSGFIDFSKKMPFCPDLKSRNSGQKPDYSIVQSYLERIEMELDKENPKLARDLFESGRKLISEISDESWSLKFELVDCRILQRTEKIREAKEKLESISKRFPNDSAAFLYLAEIFLNDGNFEKNKEFLAKAEKINPNSWLLKLQQLSRNIWLGEGIEHELINEKNFPTETTIKTSFYRLGALSLEFAGNNQLADQYIEKAIYCRPERFSNYLVKMTILEKRLTSSSLDEIQFQKNLLEIKEEFQRAEIFLAKISGIEPRIRALVNQKKLTILRLEKDFSEFVRVGKEQFNLLLSCYFDSTIEFLLFDLLSSIVLPSSEIYLLLNYLKGTGKEVSEGFAKALVFQLANKNLLLSEGKAFFGTCGPQFFFSFAKAVEANDCKRILDHFKDDFSFAATFINSIKYFPEIRKNLINLFPDSQKSLKEKLLLSYYCDEGNHDEAFNLLRNLDFSTFDYPEFGPLLTLVRKKKAWDFEVEILNRLLPFEKDPKGIQRINLGLFSAYQKLGNNLEIIQIGKELLKNNCESAPLGDSNAEIILAQIISVYLKREDFALAKEILGEFYPPSPSFEFLVGIESECFLKNNEPQKALNSIVDGVKKKKNLTPEEYAKLYYDISIRLKNSIDLTLESLPNVIENSFVKLKGQDRWYYIGKENELDATKISSDNNRFELFLNKKNNEVIFFESNYSSEKKEETIESILSIEKYILWQAVHNFTELSKEERWDGARMIEVPQKDGKIDTTYLSKFLEDQHKPRKPFFDLYCKNNIPLAMLAANEGGLISAIGRIQNENCGYINFCNGSEEEFKFQQANVINVFEKQLPFFIDGTSALFLSEFGIMEKVANYFPNLRVPQSVVNFLCEVCDKFNGADEQAFYMGYAQGKISFSSIENSKRAQLYSNFKNGIRALEAKKESIFTISSANKVDCFSERKVPTELCDACILAQNHGISILTEDFLFLQMNEIETKKNPPNYFSSLVLLRVLYEDKKITFEEYLDYFGYLSSYRFKFLFFSQNDIVNSILGSGKIKVLKPENIRKLNFRLTLSEEYGVPFHVSFNVLAHFLFEVIDDDSIYPEIARNVFIELMDSLPNSIKKRSFGEMLLAFCTKKINLSKSEFFLCPKGSIVQNKINLLWDGVKIFS